MRLAILTLMFLFVAVATPAPAADYEPGPYEDEQASQSTNPRSDFWRQVRDGMPGRVNVPDQDKGVLIRQGGNDWVSTRSNVVANYGRQIIAVGLLLVLVFMVMTGRIKMINGPVGWALDKLSPIQRPAHWVAALCFVLLGVTGLNILYGKRVLTPLMGREAFSDFAYIGKFIHNQASWIFMAAIAIVLILRARMYLPGFVRKHVSRKSPSDWAKVNRSEKVLFWFAAVGTLIVAYSGASLLIPMENNELRQMQLFQLMHSFSALTLTGLIVGNVYLISVGIRENAQKLMEAKEFLEAKVKLRTHELQMANDQLSTEIIERQKIEDALNVAKDVAEQANLSKDKFLATASHDLLQPLTAARLMIATLRMRELRPENKSVVNQVHQSLRGTENLLKDLLDISRLGANTTKPEVIDFPVHKLLSDLEVEFQPVARQKGLRLRLMCPSLFGKSDFQLLSRVLRNFLSNAIRYTEEGGVLLGARKRGDGVRIEVWDTGPGIPVDKLLAVFEEFHRLRSEKAPLDPADSGAGLGLAIVDRISDLLGHTLKVRSTLGKGSVFSIDIGRGTEIAHIPSPEAVNADKLGGIVIAAVDNDAEVLTGLKTYFQEWGCTVLAGTSGDELLDQLSWSSYQPDIVLADYHLDDGHIGPEVVELVRRNYGETIPAIVISADHTEDMRKNLTEAGYHFLSKPVRPAKLRALISHLVSDNQEVVKVIGVREA